LPRGRHTFNSLEKFPLLGLIRILEEVADPLAYVADRDLCGRVSIAKRKIDIIERGLACDDCTNRVMGDALDILTVSQVDIKGIYW
jgi:hypothetical protein